MIRLVLFLAALLMSSIALAEGAKKSTQAECQSCTARHTALQKLQKIRAAKTAELHDQANKTESAQGN